MSNTKPITFPARKHFTINVSAEELASSRAWMDERYLRKVKERIVHPPTEADWETYREGVALLEKLRENKYYEEGGPDEGSSIEKPYDRIEYVYAETHDEWLTRVRALIAEDSK